MNLLKEWKYDKSTFRLWRKIEGVDEGFKHVLLDGDIKVVGIQAMNTGTDGHMYVEHNVSSNCEYVFEPKCIELMGSEDDGDDNSSEDEARGVRLDDSEEERALGLDDGFGVFEVEQPANGSNRVEIGGQSFRLKTVANKSPGKKGGADKLKGKMKVKVPVSMPRGSTSVLDPEDE